MSTFTKECSHPPDQRWQYQDMWLCCACGFHFWGKKDKTPPADIYGRTEFPHYERTPARSVCRAER